LTFSVQRTDDFTILFHRSKYGRNTLGFLTQYQKKTFGGFGSKLALTTLVGILFREPSEAIRIRCIAIL